MTECDESDCDKPRITYCASCNNDLCCDHQEGCPKCQYVLCDDCLDEHRCSVEVGIGVNCNIDRCMGNIMKCKVCDKTYCDECYLEHFHVCSNEQIERRYQKNKRRHYEKGNQDERHYQKNKRRHREKEEQDERRHRELMEVLSKILVKKSTVKIY